MNIPWYKRTRNFLLFLVFSCILGAGAGAFTWAFFYFMGYGIDVIWKTVPKALGAQGITLALYPLIACTVGGLLIGLFQKYAGPYPDDLNDVVSTIKQRGSFPTDHIGRSFFGALLPLFFGGSVGPEAGLTGVIAGICSAIGERMHFAGTKLKEVAASQTAAVLTAIYGAPLFGFFGAIAGYTDNPGAVPVTTTTLDYPKRTKMIVYLAAIASALATIILLGQALGGGLAMPRFSHVDMSAQDLLACIPTILLATFCGWLFHGAGAFCDKLSLKMKGATITKAVVAGVILGAFGCVLPFVMFAGEDQVATLESTWLALGPVILIATGVFKVFATQLCLKLGWRGGHFFPLIFAGIALGYGCACLTGANAVCLVCAATSALMGAVMQKPLFTVFLLFLCFPAQAAFIMLFSAGFGALIPVPSAWQEKDDSN